MELDVLLHGGVPEAPETVYERDINNNVGGAACRSSLHERFAVPDAQHELIIGTIEVDLTTGDIRIESAIPDSEG